MYTQCSKCETVFKLSAEVLRAAGGQVRCGKCGEVFNALAHLAEDPSAFVVEETEIDLEFRADSILQSPAPMTPAPEEEPEPSDSGAASDLGPLGVETARLQIVDWDVSEAPEASPPDSEEAPAIDLDEDSLGDNSLADNSLGDNSLGDNSLGDTSMEFTLPPGELDRIFVESKKRAAADPPASGAEAPPPRPVVEQLLHEAPNPPPAPPPAQPIPPHPEDVAIRAAVASGFEVSEDVRREMLSGMVPSAETAQSAATPGIGRPIQRRTTPFDLDSPHHASRLPWLIAAMALGLLLSAQFVHHNRESFAAMFSKVGAPGTAAATLSVYQLRQWGVTGDPAGEGTLRVRASILNTAAQLKPYPLLRVTLANRFGGSIGTRDFEPSEYLGKPTAKLLAPGERADAVMDILDPGKNAEGFEIDVCLRGTDRKVSCANDAAPAQAKR